MSSWAMLVTREDDALCAGGCGYRLPLYTMAFLRPDQRNHCAKGRCRPCYDRDKKKEVI